MGGFNQWKITLRTSLIGFLISLITMAVTLYFQFLRDSRNIIIDKYESVLLDIRKQSKIISNYTLSIQMFMNINRKLLQNELKYFITHDHAKEGSMIILLGSYFIMTAI